ncbi:haloacid dehalogenase superfamily, subfamily IA, variant 1 with third motif having Dx(3-4)D or Dx(3-4)E [Geodermatophilus obscurus]|uniref:Haloacid dehalogenase superfamily, subfamily IA, variant 1 with third motif having Dx(3-4)D or Dx(3-4)E n=1 Tax=Geodermatophilus obscurus TaxID=1861 RepID=A0A1M7S221_9ACTN|nr:HAD-IA family hydrolase [Geodermatophilus obscurus]SHN52689.1 haloacid dehalogenase superfamily, subfamily IA, variant 1 with third motif having Dx(3-4)D or Dx(3-4)E [Geodermatophilus obscurus]
MSGAVISLDVGGTLVRTSGPSLAALLLAASPLQAPAARSVIRRELYTRPRITDEVIAAVCTGLQIPRSAFPRQHAPVEVSLQSTTPTVLRQLSRSAKLVTLSNVTCLDDDPVLHDLLAPWISRHFPSSRLGYAKPDPAAFHAVAAACGVPTTTLVHVGDDWECDIVGAARAGAVAVWLAEGRPIPDVDLLADGNVLITHDLPTAARRVGHYLKTRRQRSRR